MTPVASLLNRDTTSRQEFEDRGFVGPVSFLSALECSELLTVLRQAKEPPDWEKALATTNPACYDIASSPAIVGLLTELIGEDVMLWGASLVTRRPGQVHPWHTDIETSAALDGSVSIWLGLEHTDPESSLLLLPFSHRFGTTVQERAARAGLVRTQLSKHHVAAWSREFEPCADPVQLEMRDGDAVLFDGRLWHASNNAGKLGARTALLLQYARPDRPIFMPNLQKLDYPFTFIEQPRPACLIIHGSAAEAQNRIVPAPPPDKRPEDQSWVKTIEMPLDEDSRRGWTPYRLFNGRTATMASLSCHVSVLSAGRMPHEPHDHPEDELLIMLDGAAELVLKDSNGDRREEPVVRGSFACYPSGLVQHSIRNSSSMPATYLMFKWRNERLPERPEGLQPGVYHAAELLKRRTRPVVDGLSVAAVFDGPMPCLSRLTCHVSLLEPGGGYQPHVDRYDVAIVVLNGTLETMGQRAGPNSIFFMAAGEFHGMFNPGDETATYIVFEFHGGPGAWSVPLTQRLVRRIPRRVIELLPVPVRKFGGKLLRF